jgi:hypothetical protein
MLTYARLQGPGACKKLSRGAFQDGAKLLRDNLQRFLGSFLPVPSLDDRFQLAGKRLLCLPHRLASWRHVRQLLS